MAKKTKTKVKTERTVAIKVSKETIRQLDQLGKGETYDEKIKALIRIAKANSVLEALGKMPKDDDGIDLDEM